MKYLILLILLSSVGYSQSIHIFDIDTTDFPTMRAKFWAFDKDGKHITNLSPSDFELTENGIQRTITNINCPNPKLPTALSTVLVIDKSGSMEGENLEKAKSAARAWINALPKESECAITTFNKENYLNQDFTRDKKRLLEKVDLLSVDGGTSFDAALIEPLSGGLHISSNGKSKKVIVLLSDGISSLSKKNQIISEAKNQNCIIYCVTLGMTAPQDVKDIAEQTGGEWFDNVTTINEAEQVYREILSISQGNNPCLIEWGSINYCSNLVNLGLKYLGVESKLNYRIPENKIGLLKFDPPFLVRIQDPKIGKTITKQVKITAQNISFNVSDIISTNPNFFIKPSKFTLNPNESRYLTVSYHSTDSLYNFTEFNFINNNCEQNYFASGGFIGKKHNNPTLKLTYPNGDEEFVIGSDTIISWEGILPSEKVKLSYSKNNGISWNLITNQASGLKYNWNKTPKPISDSCLIKIQQYIISNIDTLNNPTDTMLGHKDWIIGLDISNDGNYTSSGGTDSTIKIWDTYSGQLLKTIKETGDVYSLDINPDGNFIASSTSDKKIKVWNLHTGQLIQTISVDREFIVNCVRFSPDGKLLAFSGWDHNVYIWDFSSSKIIKSFKHSTKNSVRTFDFNYDGTIIVSGGMDKNVKIWDMLTENVIKTIDNNLLGITTVKFSPVSNIFAYSAGDSIIKIFDLDKNELINILDGHENRVISISFSPDGTKLVSGSEDNTIRIWDLMQGKEIKILYGHKDDVTNAIYYDDGNSLVSSGYDGTLKIWSVKDDYLQSDISDNVFSIVEPIAQAIDIDMGSLLVSDIKDTIVSAFVSNVGTYPFTVDSIYFQGADANAFSLVSGVPEYNVEPSNTHFGEFRFSPNRVGLHNAEVVIITQSDTLTQSIIGVGVEQNLAVLENFIDFGQVYLGEFKDTLQTITIKNIGTVPFTITETKHTYPNDVDFTTISGGGNFTLQANETKAMELRFAPSDVGRTSGMLEFHYNGVGSPALIQLFGEGIDSSPASLKIETIELEAYIGQEIEIPILITEQENLSSKGIKSISTNLVFNPTLLLPIDYDVKKVDDYTAYIEINDIPINDEIKSIRCKVGLGNSEESELMIYNPVAIGGDADITLVNGNFKLLGICYEGGTRLINPNSNISIKNLAPNPAQNKLEINLSLIEKGKTELSVYNMSGEKVNEILNDEVSDTGDKIYNVNISSLPSGNYFVVLITPTYTEKKKFIIQR